MKSAGRKSSSAGFRNIATGPIDLLESLQRLLDISVIYVDGRDRIILCNELVAEHFHATPEQMAPGQPLTSIPDTEELVQLLARTRQMGITQSADIPLPPPLLRSFAVALPYRITAKDPADSVLLVVRNTSQMYQLEQAGEEYAHNVSHELKTPLTVLQGYTEVMLARKDLPDKERKEFLDTMLRNIKRISEIVTDLLHLAWLSNEYEGSPRKLARSMVGVSKLIQNSLRSFQEWTSDVEVKMQVPPSLHWSMNGRLMEEAVTNLLKNAFLYALGKPIVISAAEVSGHLEIRVKDEGPGMSKEIAARIFDRFYRGDSGRSRATGGSGLGLPIVQQILAAHGGRARVESRLGKGTTFILEIPRH